MSDHPVGPVSGPPSSFDYSALTPATADWLRTRRDTLRTRIVGATAQLIEIGTILLDVRQRLGRKRFKRWLETETPFSRMKSQRLMQVAEVFRESVTPGSAQIEHFQPSALYLLAWPGVPVAARQEAMTRVQAGRTVTHAEAKRLIAAHRPARPGTYPDGPRMPIRPDQQPARNSVERAAAYWERLVRLLRECDTVHLSRVPDADADDTFQMTAYPAEPAEPVRHGVRADLGWLVSAMIGEEPHRVCPRCEEDKLLSGYSADINNADGRTRYCRSCEARRDQRDPKRHR